MSNKDEIIRNRKETQQEILSMKEKIPSAVVLKRLGKPFKSGSLMYWLLSIVSLNIILMSPWIILGVALNEMAKFTRILAPFMISIQFIVFGFLLVHIVAQYILSNMASRIIERITSVNDLSKILLWFRKTWSTRPVITFVLIFCVIWACLGVGSISIFLHEFVGWGASLTIVIAGVLAGLMYYVLLWISLLVSNLKNYQYELNIFSPADSEIISSIAEIFTKCIYTFAIFSAIITLISTSSLIDEPMRVIFSVPLAIIGWSMIAMQFSLTHATLGEIVYKAKWRTLNKLQAQINAIESTGDLSDKETAEKFLRLVDIHKQIMASKMNIFNWNSISVLLSQLMLPLLGLLLGNLDKILKFFP